MTVKEFEALIATDVAHAVADALDFEGFSCTIVVENAIMRAFFGSNDTGKPQTAKIEVLCDERDVERVVKIIQDHSRPTPAQSDVLIAPREVD